MKNLHKRAELLANIAIVIVAILLGFVLVKRFIMDSNEPPNPAAAQLARAERVPLEGIEWDKSKYTMLLVLQKGCRYCTESAPFYQRLISETANRSDMKLIALLPDSVADGKQYLNEIGVNISDIRQVSPRKIKVGVTPTLILVDASGVVVDVWRGKLPPETESQVLSTLKT